MKAGVGSLRCLSLLVDLKPGHLSLKKSNRQKQDGVIGRLIFQAAGDQCKSRQVGKSMLGKSYSGTFETKAFIFTF